jgi:hypothetical protein
MEGHRHLARDRLVAAPRFEVGGIGVGEDAAGTSPSRVGRATTIASARWTPARTSSTWAGSTLLPRL